MRLATHELSLRDMEVFILIRLVRRFEMKLKTENSSQIGLFLIQDERDKIGSSVHERYGRGRQKTAIVAVILQVLYGHIQANPAARAVFYGHKR